jgi:hypothetical protein
MSDINETLSNMAFGRDSESDTKNELLKGFSSWAAMCSLKLIVAKIAKDTDADPKEVMTGLIDIWAEEQQKKNDDQIAHYKEYTQSGMGLFTQSMLGDPDDIGKRVNELLEKTTEEINGFMTDNLDKL